MYDKTFVIQVSPYPPEPGSDYHMILAKELSKLCIGVIVLSGLNFFSNIERVEKGYGELSKVSNNLYIYRSFWSPRFFHMKSFFKVFKYLILSEINLINILRIIKKFKFKTVVYFHYGPTTWPGSLLGEHYVLGMVISRLLRAKVIWIVHSFPTHYQIYNELKSLLRSKIMAFVGLCYYLLVVKTAGLAANKIVVLTNSENAPIIFYISKLLGKHKVIENIHPKFKPINKLKVSDWGSKIKILCVGYMRKEKGYNTLLKLISKLKNASPKLYKKLEILIVGGIDRKKRDDLLYLLELLRTRCNLGLNIVKITVKNLNKKEWHQMLSSSDVIWCGYEKMYGPSGILAWARGYNKKVILSPSFWGRFNDNDIDKIPDFSSHAIQLLKYAVSI